MLPKYCNRLIRAKRLVNTKLWPTEHLLFMGSEKYPGENEYDVFMSKHGGSNNAYTEAETTTYYFSIPQEHLLGALDRLAQFFVSPLMLQSGVERELKAIESEYQLNKQRRKRERAGGPTLFPSSRAAEQLRTRAFYRFQSQRTIG